MQSSEGLYGSWSPGIGDPTPAGFLTVFAYAAAAYACYRAYRRSRAAAVTVAAERRVASIWLGLSILLAALGMNKQLDLQSLLTEIGRTLAQDQGWYEQRREVQRSFVLAVAAIVCGAGLGLFALARSHIARLLPALLGAVFLLAFVLIRASSFHHVDALIATDLCGLRVNWLLELGGIAFIGFAARRDRPRRGRSASTSRARA